MAEGWSPLFLLRFAPGPARCLAQRPTGTANIALVDGEPNRWAERARQSARPGDEVILLTHLRQRFGLTIDLAEVEKTERTIIRLQAECVA